MGWREMEEGLMGFFFDDVALEAFVCVGYSFDA